MSIAILKLRPDHELAEVALLHHHVELVVIRGIYYLEASCDILVVKYAQDVELVLDEGRPTDDFAVRPEEPCVLQ